MSHRPVAADSDDESSSEDESEDETKDDDASYEGETAQDDDPEAPLLTPTKPTKPANARSSASSSNTLKSAPKTSESSTR